MMMIITTTMMMMMMMMMIMMMMPMMMMMMDKDKDASQSQPYPGHCSRKPGNGRQCAGAPWRQDAASNHRSRRGGECSDLTENNKWRRTTKQTRNSGGGGALGRLGRTQTGYCLRENALGSQKEVGGAG